MSATVRLLADLPQLVEAVGELRRREWGESPAIWAERTRREAGRDTLPVTWVAVDPAGDVLGAVALGDSDAGRTDRTPWIWGLVVRPDHRDQGIGRMLLARLEEFAAGHGHEHVWVATGGRAVEFYTRCGWHRTDRIGATTILGKRIHRH